jgi:hypothetical protein
MNARLEQSAVSDLDLALPLQALKKLREPFEKHQINLLPKPYKKDSEPGKCRDCGGWHGLPATHLEYVGHAALTARLLDVDPQWNWEPVGLDAQGLPALDKDGGLWIRLTICGVSRLGYGDAQGKTGGNATKERIGDALRNAGMRFGAALELWHKGILYMDNDDDAPLEPVKYILTRDWHADIAAAKTEKALTKVWKEGVVEYNALGDRDLYTEFKKAVSTRKAAIIEATDLARTGGKP